MPQINFDATTVDPASGSSQFEPGRYKVVIIHSETAPVRDDDQSGKLVLKLQSIEGNNAGATMNYTLNCFNKNPEAARIAWQQLSAIMHVVGYLRAAQTEELHNRPFIIDVAKQPNNDKYTQVSGVFDVNGNPPSKAGQPAAAAQPAAATMQPATQPAAQPAAGGWQAPAQAQPAAAPAAGWQAPAAAPAAAEPAPWGAGAAAPAAQPAAAGGGWQPNPAGAGAAPWGAR